MYKPLQIWLRVIHLSEIHTGDSSQISQTVWEGLKQAQMTYKWPRMQKPMKAEWQLWQCALMTVLNLNIHQILPHPMGPWLAMTVPSPRWYLDTDIPWLFKWDGTKWTFYIQIPPHTRGWQFTNQSANTMPPLNWNEWDQATIWCTQQLLTVTGTTDQTMNTKPQAVWWGATLQDTDFAKCWQSSLLGGYPQGGTKKSNSGSSKWWVF